MLLNLANSRNNIWIDDSDNRKIYSAKISRNNLANDDLGNTYYTTHVEQNNGRGGFTYPRRRPLQIYRKQYQPNTTRSNFSAIGVFDKPGISTHKFSNNNNNDCRDCCNNNLFIQHINNSNQPISSCENSEQCKFFDPCLNRIICIACNPENNITRSASTIISERYSQTTNEFLHKRHRTFNQNQLGNSITTINNSKTRSGECCSVETIISQNRNPTSSSGRIARLRHDANKKFKNNTSNYQQQINRVTNNDLELQHRIIIFREKRHRRCCYVSQ